MDFFESIAILVNTLFKNVSWYATQKMSQQSVSEVPYVLIVVPDKYKMQKIYEQSVLEDPCTLEFVPDHLKTKMCSMALMMNLRRGTLVITNTRH